jgi:hypothetical protein
MNLTLIAAEQCDPFLRRLHEPRLTGAISRSAVSRDAERCFTKASMPFLCSQRSPMASCRKSLRSAPIGRRRARRNAAAACSSNADRLRSTYCPNRSMRCRWPCLSTSLLAFADVNHFTIQPGRCESRAPAFSDNRGAEVACGGAQRSNEDDRQKPTQTSAPRWCCARCS